MTAFTTAYKILLGSEFILNSIAEEAERLTFIQFYYMCIGG